MKADYKLEKLKRQKIKQIKDARHKLDYWLTSTPSKQSLSVLAKQALDSYRGSIHRY